jgi:prefoldin subunit 5
MSEVSEAVRRLKDLTDELQQLENARDAIYAALDALEYADCEFGCTGLGYSGGLSHHASMEIEESLAMVDERIEEIEGMC